jgi:diguanylate cyclase (GGDEF)-like protein
MKFDYGFLRKKVARRVVWLFFLSALVPIAATAFFSFTYVSDLLVEQSYKRLQHAGKLYGMALLDRLLIIDDELRRVAVRMERGINTKQNPDVTLAERSSVVVGRSGYEKQIDKLTMEIVPVSSLFDEGYAPSAESKTIIYSKINPDGVTKVYLRRIVAMKKNNEATTLVAELNNKFLWGDKNSLPFSTFLCVTESSRKVLFCSHPDYDALLVKLSEASGRVDSKKVTWENADGKNLAVAWDLFIKSSFSGPDWRIISSRPEADALLPVYAFHRIFPIVILFSLLIVLLLSMIQVRKTMVPLQRLVGATRRLANSEFGEPVEVSSEDEFKELADSFNVMARRLEKQFNELKILSEIDRLILTYPDLDVVLAKIFDTAHKIMSCEFIAIILVDRTDAAIGWSYIREIAEGKLPSIDKTTIPENEAAKLLAQEDALWVDLKKQPWQILAPLVKYDVAMAQVYRILIDGELRAIFSLGYREKPSGVPEDSGYVRGIIDRLAVALATADRDEKLYRQANFDQLTGLPNRQLFNDRLEQHLIQAHRNNERAALLYIDLDRFKNINDSFGHASGDKILRQVAERMRNCVRETDTISRLGGDEFVIVLSNILSPKDAGNIATHIIDAILKPFYIYSREIFINASIGIAMYPEDGKDNKELLAHADVAMYRAKESGRGRYMFFEESMNKEIVQRMEMETAMRHALQREEFCLHYQPQVDLRSGKVMGVEALIRWHHPELGMIQPNHFIPLAEECGLIDPIGEWVLHTACKHYQHWRDMNLAPGKLAVNISSRQFMRENFVDVINRAISSAGMLSQELELEITESLLMDERMNAKSIFNKLEVMGVKIAIDDFGTGFSSLSYLKRFPVHILKIDRSFTRDIPADEQVTTLTLSIIAMAHALNMQVVAEGIETKEQLELLKSHQCDYMQGYFFSRPLPADELVLFLAQQTAKPASAN